MMEPQLAELEADIAAMKIDIAVLKANSATKADLADLKATLSSEMGNIRTGIAEAKSAIIMWVVGAIFLAQLLPALAKLLLE